MATLLFLFDFCSRPLSPPASLDHGVIIFFQIEPPRFSADPPNQGRGENRENLCDRPCSSLASFLFMTTERLLEGTTASGRRCCCRRRSCLHSISMLSSWDDTAGPAEDTVVHAMTRGCRDQFSEQILAHGQGVGAVGGRGDHRCMVYWYRLL